MQFRRPRWMVIGLVAWAVVVGLTRTARAADDDEPENLAPGLVAEFWPDAAPAAAIARVVPDLVGRWGSTSPDVRIPANDFNVRWSGFLLIQSPGKHRFHARTDGTVRLKIGDRVVLSGPGETTTGEPVELSAGFTSLVLEYRHARGDAHVALDWQGPTFRREPIPARLLFHDAAKGNSENLFEQGRQLADRLGCANCHSVLDLPRRPGLGPPLDDAGFAIKRSWLGAWLMNPAAVRKRTPMPSFGNGLSPPDASDLRAFLSARSRPTTATAEIKMALNVANVPRGQLLFRALGCLACHTFGIESGDETRSAGPNLTGLSSKRELSQLASYLVHPRGAAASEHRADMRLSPDESAHLASYLLSEPTGKASPDPLPEGSAERGRGLFERLRCGACHELRGHALPSPSISLIAGSHAEAGCLSRAPGAPSVPRFNLSEPEREALRAFVSRIPPRPSPTSQATLAHDVIRRRNCFGCHSREGEHPPVLGSVVADFLKSDPALGALKGSLTPPNLTAVGDKLRPEYLRDALQGKAPTSRPWLAVRMPSFAFEQHEVESIMAYLEGHDRMGAVADRADALAPLAPDAIESAARLIGQQGFGCVSCHVIAGRIPPGGEPETLGPDLTLAHRRLSERYFRRWVENPQRIIAGTAMPQFVKPVETIGGSLEEQLAAIWRLLGSAQGTELALSGTRELLKRQGDRALVVFDMVIVPEAPGSPYAPRGIAIGLKNDHTLLFDADRLCWLAWWQRGFLSRTKSGRLWEWHPEGARLWTAPARRAPIVFLGPDGSAHEPAEVRERFGRLGSIAFEGAGVVVSYGLNGPADSSPVVTERIRPIESGWEREIDVTAVPDGFRPAVLECLPGATANGGTVRWSAGETRLALSIEGADQVPAAGLRGKDLHVFALGRKDARTYAGRVKLSVER